MSTRAHLFAGGMIAATTMASGQVIPITDDAFVTRLHTWNAATAEVGSQDFRPQASNRAWRDALTWHFQQAVSMPDGMGGTIESANPPIAVPVNDPSAPGITAAFQFPEARATTIRLNGPAGMPAAGWEVEALPDTSGALEIWFKLDDLNDNHVIIEIGARNRGIAIAVEGDQLVFAATASNGPATDPSTAIVDYVHREPITAGEWHQAVLTVDFLDFRIDAFVDGQSVDTLFAQNTDPMGNFPVAAGYRWASANPSGLGTVGSDPDPMFSDAGIAADAILRADLTDFDGQIAIQRFYSAGVLFPSEVLANYNAIVDMDAAVRRADRNNDAAVNGADVANLIDFYDLATGDPVAGLLPFPVGGPNGAHMGDPALDETYPNDNSWDRNGGFNAQEPSFLLNSGVLDPVAVNDTNFPTIRRAFNMDGMADSNFQGPFFQQIDDSASVRTQLWVRVDDLVGQHCLFEAGGDNDLQTGLGYSIFLSGDRILAGVNARPDDGLDIINLDSGPIITPGWHLIETVVRAFGPPAGTLASDALGEGMELYVDGVLVDSVNDDAGPDMEFGTADDINNASIRPVPAINNNFIGGNRSGLAAISGVAFVPAGINSAALTSFDGGIGPIRLIQTAPQPDEILVEYQAQTGAAGVNARLDVNRDGQANVLDLIEQLKEIDAGM